MSVLSPLEKADILLEVDDPGDLRVSSACVLTSFTGGSPDIEVMAWGRS